MVGQKGESKNKIVFDITTNKTNDLQTQKHIFTQTHLFTCEIYRCYKCEKIFKTLKDIMKHDNEKISQIDHIKIDRNGFNETTELRHAIA